MSQKIQAFSKADTYQEPKKWSVPVEITVKVTIAIRNRDGNHESLFIVSQYEPEVSCEIVAIPFSEATEIKLTITKKHDEEAASDVVVLRSISEGGCGGGHSHQSHSRLKKVDAVVVVVSGHDSRQCQNKCGCQH